MGNWHQNNHSSHFFKCHFPPPSSGNSCSHMSIKKFQIMRKAHILRMFDLHLIFVVSIGQTSRPGYVRQFFKKTQQMWHCPSKYKTLFLKQTLRSSSNLLPLKSSDIHLASLLEKKEHLLNFMNWTCISFQVCKFMFLSLAFFQVCSNYFVNLY